MSKKNSNEKFLFGTAFGIGLSTIVYVFFDSIIATDFRYVASPLIAFLALCLAGYSAYKVSKWADSKINETKYKSLEEIIGIQVDTQVELLKAHYFIKTLTGENTNKSYADETCKKLNGIYDKVRINLDLLPNKMLKIKVIGVDEEKYNHNTKDIINGIESLVILSKLLNDQKTRVLIVKSEKQGLKPDQEFESFINSHINTLENAAKIKLVTFQQILEEI